MLLRVNAFARGVEPDAAARWWSDFREGRSDHRFIPGHERRIVERGNDHITMEEETRFLRVTLFRERTTAWPSPRAVRFVGQNNFAGFEGTYSFEPAEGGSRIGLEARVTLRKPLAWGDKVGKPLVAGILRADLAAHVREMQRDVGHR